MRLAGEFFGRAFSPALQLRRAYVGGALALPVQALEAAFNTVVFAAAALSLALVGGLILGFLGTSTWSNRGSGQGGNRRRPPVHGPHALGP